MLTSACLLRAGALVLSAASAEPAISGADADGCSEHVRVRLEARLPELGLDLRHDAPAVLAREPRRRAEDVPIQRQRRVRTAAGDAPAERTTAHMLFNRDWVDRSCEHNTLRSERQLCLL